MAVIAAVIAFALTGCIPPPQIADESVQKDINYLLAVNKGLRKKVAELETRTAAMARDVEETRRGLAALSVETKSAMAESNADFDRFLEEFSYVQGGSQETAHVRQRFRDDITFLKEQQVTLGDRLEEVKTATVAEAKSGTKTDKQLTATVKKLTAKLDALGITVDELGRTSSALSRKTASVEGRIQDLEPLVLEGRKSPNLAPTLKKLFADPKELYMEGYKQVMSKDYTAGTKTLKEFLKRYPDHELADNAQYWLAETYFSKGEWERAVLEFNKVTKNYPKGDKVASSLLKQGMSFNKIGMKKEARVILQRVIDDHPDTAAADKAKEELKATKE